MICRVKFGESMAGKFLSHLDMLRAWQRAIVRSGLNLAYSQGFNKHPKLSFSSALAVGLTSSGEYVDIELNDELPAEEIFERLKRHLPPALEIYAVKVIDDKAPPVMSIIQRAEYNVIVKLEQNVSLEEINSTIESLLNSPALEVERRKKNSREKKLVDIRPGIYRITAEFKNNTLIFNLLLQNNSDGNVKPDEVVNLIIKNYTGLEITQIHRQELYTIKDEQMLSPMEV